MKKTAILLRGPAAVGKSTIARELRDKIGNAVLLDIDYLRYMFGGKPRNKQDKNIAYRNCVLLAKQFVKYDYNIIIEELLYSQHDINYFIKIFQKMGYKIKIFTLTAPLKTLIKRNKERANYKSLRGRRIKDLYYDFETSQIKTSGIVINTDEHSLSAVVNKIYKLIC